MPFRRGFKRRFRRGGFRRRTPLARVRRTWMLSQNLPCTWQELDFVPQTDVDCSHTLVYLSLVGNDDIQEKFSDRCTVKRIVGEFMFQPDPQASQFSTFQDYLAAVASFQPYARIGLVRQVLTSDQAAAKAPPDPLSPMDDYDLPEGQWKRVWDHYWPTNVGLRLGETQLNQVQLNFAVRNCDNVQTTGATDNDFVDGTGTINIETDCGDVSCFPCDQGDFTANDFSSTLSTHAPWRFRFDIKKSIPLRENQTLGFWLGFTSMLGFNAVQSGWADGTWAWNMSWAGHARTLIQMG